LSCYIEREQKFSFVEVLGRVSDNLSI